MNKPTDSINLLIDEIDKISDAVIKIRGQLFALKLYIEKTEDL